MKTADNHLLIRPELIATKLDLIRNFALPALAAEMDAQPRFAEVLWFLAFVSRDANYAGGLRKFCLDLIAQSTDLLGTATMATHGPAAYSDETVKEILSEIPGESRARFAIQSDYQIADAVGEERGYYRFGEIGEMLGEEPRSVGERETAAEAARARGRLEAKRLEIFRRKLEHGIAEELREIAEERLAQYLPSLCECPDVQFLAGRQSYPWYFVRFAEAILRFIDRRKVLIAATIAETSVSREISRWLEIARSTGKSIVIQGNSRFGKTEAIRAWAAMHPGQARIVETPSSGGESELLRAVAKALGIEINARQRGHQVRGQIEFVLKQFRPVLIFEEATFLFPANFSKNTTPNRLNWVRRSVMDAGIPCAFVWTPQTHHATRSRFLKATNYAIEQFDGRILRIVNLPAEIPEEDLLAIARIHFRELPDRQREIFSKIVVATVAPTERNYCSDVSSIAALTFHCAEANRRKVPALKDLESAIADVLPAAEVREAPFKKQPRQAVPRQAVPMTPEALGASRATPMHAPCKAGATRPHRAGVDASSDLVEHSDLLPVNRTVLPVVLPA